MKSGKYFLKKALIIIFYKLSLNAKLSILTLGFLIAEMKDRPVGPSFHTQSVLGKTNLNGQMMVEENNTELLSITADKIQGTLQFDKSR